MEESLSFVEYEERPINLSPEDAAHLRRLAAQDIIRDLDPGRYLITPKQWVGVVALPSGLRIEIRPKVPLRNLLHMIWSVSDVAWPFGDEPAFFAKSDDSIMEFLAFHFANLVDRQILRGLYRSYCEREENISMIRGQVDFPEDRRQNAILRHRTYCRFSDFTWDIPENQIVRQVVHFLCGWNFPHELQLKLRKIDATLSQIEPVMLSAAVMDRFHYHRFNDEYRQIHGLCRLFLEGSSVSEECGPFEYRAFLTDMNTLFQQFVTRVLQDCAPTGLTVDSKKQVYLDEDENADMYPDLLVRRKGKIALVADCKYKREQPGADIYQVLAYCTAEKANRGLLVYPLDDQTESAELRIRNTGISIHQLAIDLNKGSVDELDSECQRFARRVFELAS